MRLVHLTASTFFGGPERQMLGLAQAMRDDATSSFICFREGDRSSAFLEQVHAHGFDGHALQNDSPKFRATTRELTALIQESNSDVLLCHGYKANLLGRIAARRVGIPAIAVSRGWTGENRKVRVYEWLDRRHLRWMDHVVAVSDGQAGKVLRTGLSPTRMSVNRNSARLSAFESVDESYRLKLREFFDKGCERVIIGAGRLSPEKGFVHLIDAAKTIIDAMPSTRFLLFGEGNERANLELHIRELGLEGRFVLAGFRRDLDAFLPFADVMVLPSYTEGLPNVLLEASAAGVPSVATAVGGSPEVVVDGETGYLVQPRDANAIATNVLNLLNDENRRSQFGRAAQDRMRTQFTFEAQARGYLELLETLVQRSPVACVGGN